MFIRYLGPRNKINVAPHGRHLKDEVKEDPDDFGADLLVTSKRQKFEEVDVFGRMSFDPEKMTVAQLRSLCTELEIEFAAKDKKADLIALIEKNTAEHNS